MSIYSKSPSELTWADLQELQDNKSVENVRLEFKVTYPDKDGMLKKLSSFANTFGGYLVVGAEAESSDSRIKAIPGVDPKSSYKQTIVQWCTEGAYPPITVEVSDPIEVAGSSGRVCYVIMAAESELAPHFLNDRKGVYIRTDEISHRFEPQLAEEHELRMLLNRRQLIRERRSSLLERAHERFQTFIGQQEVKPLGGRMQLPVFLTLTIVPRYPTKPVVGHADLLKLFRQTYVPWSLASFPSNPNNVISQHESAIALNAARLWSMIEANTWGLLSYSTSIGEELVGEEFKGQRYVHLRQFCGYILVFLQHAAILMKRLKLAVTMHVEVRIWGVRSVPWLHFGYGYPAQAPGSSLDDAITFSLTEAADRFFSSPEELAKDLLRLMFFAMNLPNVADSPEKLANLVADGRGFNAGH